MEYIKLEEAANKWGLSVRRAQDLCKLGRVPGAKRFGTNWMVPSDARRPVDGRSKEGKAEKANPFAYQPLIRKTPFLVMTDLYQVPGTADQCIADLESYPEAQALFEADIAYCRGEIDKVYEHATYFLERHSGFYAIISGGMLLALVAMWKGDIALWKKARKHICEAPWKDEKDLDIISLSLASTDLSVRNTKDFPEWFCRGRFENLPPDAHPAARVYYLKYLLIFAQEFATGRFQMEDVSGLGMMRFHPYIMEPMVSQAVTDKTVVAEIYLRLICAVAYRQTGDDENAAFHLDKAIALCLPDKLYGPLVEHRRQLGLFLDERLFLVDAEAAKKVKELHKVLHEGWVTIHNEVMENNMSSKLSDREREVARFAAFGLSDEEIASYLHITKSSVKSMVQMARNKTGIKGRGDFGSYI